MGVVLGLVVLLFLFVSFFVSIDSLDSFYSIDSIVLFSSFVSLLLPCPPPPRPQGRGIYAVGIWGGCTGGYVYRG